MIRALESDEVERILRAEAIGRIGCYAGERTYVVPVCYAYEDGSIYVHSRYGQKIEMMRRNPSVCFEVEHVEDLVNWNTAICWGTYEELEGADAERALSLLRGHIEAGLPRVFEHGQPVGEATVSGDKPIVYRIRLTKTSGREERLHWELLPAPREVSMATTSFQSTPAERWLSHERAQQFADISAVLDVEDIWAAADKLATGRPFAEVTASLTYQGLEADLAQRIIRALMELRDGEPLARRAPVAMSS